MKKILKELKLIFQTALYFLAWFGFLMLIKVLLLHEYKIEFYNYSTAIVGALVVAKTVLILNNVPVSGKATQAAFLVLLKRTFFFLAGVFIILVLEKTLESMKESGGFINALKNLPSSADRLHILVNTVCILGSLIFYNLWWLLKRHLGDQSFLSIMGAPVPGKPKK